jgi:hypothetical protein
MNRARALLGLLGAGLLASGCTPWVVVRQASPNPLAGQTQFQLQPLNFDALYVGDKTQAEYLAGKDPDQRASWQADLLAMNQIFAERLYGNTPGLTIVPFGQAQARAPFTIVPRILFIEPGFYAGVVAASAQVRMALQIQGPQGRLDEIHVEVSVPADLVNAASGQRLRQAAAQLGNVAARYLRERVGI